MVFTDTHTHLYVEQFKTDREEVVQRAIEQGVSRLFLPAIDASYKQEMLKLKKAFPDNIFLMSGLHPTHVKEDNEQELDHVAEFLKDASICAVGEIGIDLYWDRTYISQQQEIFSRQITMANDNNLPIVIHCRDSFDEIVEVLEGHRDEGTKGIFHCFTGTEEQAEKAISLNMKLGIGGVVTYKNSGLDNFLQKIPLEHIVLETDSPYLAPVPYRGKRNESAYLIEIAKMVSEIYNLPLEEIAAQTTSNSKSVFAV